MKKQSHRQENTEEYKQNTKGIFQKYCGKNCAVQHILYITTIYIILKTKNLKATITTMWNSDLNAHLSHKNMLFETRQKIL